MSDNQTKNSNELKTTNQIINEQIKKIEQDTRELINRTIDGQPAQVSVVKVSDNKIIIEVDLNNFKFSPTSAEPIENDNTDKVDQSKSALSIKSTAQPDYDQQPDNQDDKPTLKGILKYSNNWKKRTLSSSSEFDNSSSFTDHEDYDDLSLSCTDLDVLVDKSNSKKVTFNKQISSKLFSKNQRTIESRPKKGKKKKNNKKAKSNDDQKKPVECTNSLNAKANESLNDDLSTNRPEDVTVDELSFLVCSSDSETGMLFGKLDDSKSSMKISEDDILDQQIDHAANDKENWSEVRSSKKMKKNRKRNDSGNSIDESNDTNQTNVDLVDSISKASDSSNAPKTVDKNSGKSETCDQQSSVRKQMSLGIKNLEIQVN